MQTFAAEGRHTKDVLLRLSEELKEPQVNVSFLFVFFSSIHNPELIREFLQDFFPNAEIIGSTTHSALVTEKGTFGDGAIGLLAITDPTGVYGSALTSMSDLSRDIGERALGSALARTVSPGELPALVWIQQTPGHGALCLDGISHILTDRCPVAGGVAADNNGQGAWKILTQQACDHNGIAVAVISPSTPIGTAQEYSAIPTGHSGILTMAEGRRILEIDGNRAWDTFQEWTTALPDTPEEGNTRHPYGLRISQNGKPPTYILAFPEPHGTPPSLTTLIAPPTGQRVHFMATDGYHLKDRTRQICTHARIQLPEKSRLAGAVIICNAAATAICRDACAYISAGAHDAFHDAPFLAAFTYGEIGFVAGHNHHDNLMLSATAFTA